MKRWYAGVNNQTKTTTIFGCDIAPTYESHGHLYGHVFGAYRTRKQAIQVAQYQTTTYTIKIGGYDEA